MSIHLSIYRSIYMGKLCISTYGLGVGRPLEKLQHVTPGGRELDSVTPYMTNNVDHRT